MESKSNQTGLIARLRSQHDGMLRKGEFAFLTKSELGDLLATVESLTKERDEARRRLCVELLEVEGLPLGWTGARGAKGIAERLGWDCFKEEL